MRTPTLDMKVFKNRRQRIGQDLKGSAVIIPAHPHFIRNNDVHHHYRQDSNFYYLTGFEEPHSWLVFRPGKDPETVLFVREKNPERETWDGFRYGPEGAVKNFGADQAFPIGKLDEILPDLLKDVDKVYYQMIKNPENDQIVLKAIETTAARKHRSGQGFLPIFDSYAMLGEYRLFKEPFELEQIRKACKVSAEAHVEVMRTLKPGMNENAVHGTFIKAAMERGSSREGYGGIVAGGNNGTTLHYVFNDQPLKDGDLLLIDCGAEINYYTGDITRTYPVNGKFTPTQKRIYEKILDFQKKVISIVKPGVVWDSFQKMTIERMTEIMIEEKALKGNRDELISSRAYLKYYPHGLGHFLGLDVHDAGKIQEDGKSRLLKPGMVFTVEPGLYFPANDTSIPEDLRGIGIRIEDNIVVTENGCENMTIFAPKEVADLEDLIGRG